MSNNFIIPKSRRLTGKVPIIIITYRIHRRK